MHIIRFSYMFFLHCCFAFTFCMFISCCIDQFIQLHVSFLFVLKNFSIFIDDCVSIFNYFLFPTCQVRVLRF